MLSLSNSSFPSFGWPSDDILQSNNNKNTNDTYNDNELLIVREFLESSSHSPSSHQPQPYSEPNSSLGASGDPHISANKVMKKKQNHNSNERVRRIRINSLYAALRSLLPDSDQTRKLSIPGTLSQMVKYIPELQKEVKMYQKKEELLLVELHKRKDQIMGAHEKKQEIRGSVMMGSSLISVSASSLANNNEVLVQFSTTKFNQNLMSKVLEKLEEDGLRVLNASSYESGDNIFHSLHLQVHGTLQYVVDAIPQRLLRHCSMRN